MTTSIDTILGYNSIDLSLYEIRGAKYGINNARTTGPVYVGGSYIPSTSTLIADGSFSQDSSLVMYFSFQDYPTLNTSSLRVGDIATIDGNIFTIKNIKNSTEFYLSGDSGVNGTRQFDMTLSTRDYVIEPDIDNNTFYGKASFIQGSPTVYGVETSWGSDIVLNDFIKSHDYQKYYKIASVNSPTQLTLVSPYEGVSNTTDYTGKKWYIGNTDIRYSTENVIYDNQKAVWKYDNISMSKIPTSINFSNLSDGIVVKFTHSLTPTSPDIMDVATANEKILNRKTQYDTYQFALPVVPQPDTMTLKINNSVKDMFPLGNQDYVLTYSQSPVYELPPPPKDRQVANIMFLARASNFSMDTSLTSQGQFYLTDSTGNIFTGLMPGAEKISIEDIDQTAYRDYVLDANTGLVAVINSNINEEIVKYIASNFNSVINYGVSIYCNGIKQKISIPPNLSDDVLFQAEVGRIKPSGQDHPGPNDVYEIDYFASGQDSVTDLIQAYPGQTVLKTSTYPIQQGSMLLKEANSYLTEGEDYVVGYLTGSILLSNTVTTGNTFTAVYSPLSKQVNDLIYSDSTAYCIVNDSRLIVRDTTGFGFTFVNKNISYPDTDIIILRIYNETRQAEYDITGCAIQNNSFSLIQNTANRSIGLGLSDIVVADYRLTQDYLEYTPAQVINMNLLSGSRKIYFEGLDLTPSIFVGSIIILTAQNSVDNLIYSVEEISYNDSGTMLTLSTSLAVDMVNPNVYITDSPIQFNSCGVTLEPFIEGSDILTINGIDLRRLLKPGTIIRLLQDYYQVLVSNYSGGLTTVTLTSTALRDYINLSNFFYSDAPVYLEGQSEIYPKDPIVTLSRQPALILNYSNDTISVTSDSSKITVDGTNFLYKDYINIGSLVQAMTDIPDLSATTYVPFWKSNSIIPSSVSVFPNSNTVLYADDVLRFKNDIDSTNFILNASGSITLTTPLKRSDRYYLDYIGARFLGTSKVSFSTRYFTVLPAGSKVVATFEYNNLDQFYIQSISQKEFLETVTKPRMTEEANQLNGNVGQGGEIPSDENTGSSSGGLFGDEYRRQDANIECKIFKNIYNFFQNRLEAYKNELEAGFGLKLFNNDGVFSEEQQTAGMLPINRIFPLNYSNIDPRTCNPLTGYFFNSGTIFTKYDSVVRNSQAGSSWLTQLSAGGFIARADSSKYYRIASINSNNELVLDRTFEEESTIGRPDNYQASHCYLPLYDDDGYLGPKIISASVNQTTGWGLVVGDKFICNIDGSDSTYIFEDPAIKFSPLPSLVAYAIQPPPSQLNVSQIIDQLNSIPGLSVTYDRILDTQEPYGYRSTIILRTDGTYNTLTLSDSITAQAISKLGFTPGASAVGNWDRTDHSPEIILAANEKDYRWNDWNILLNMQDEVNKLDRLTVELPYMYEIIYQEMDTLSIEMIKLQTEISATGELIKERSIFTYNDSSSSHLKATEAYQAAVDMYNYDTNIYLSDWKWPIDFQDRTAYITNIDGQTTLTLTAPPGNDIRILNTTINSVLYTPVVVFNDNDTSAVGGTWAGWYTFSPINNQYSTNNEIVFTISSTPVITITAKSGTFNAYYIVDNTALNLFWDTISNSYSAVYTYTTYTTISNIVANINDAGFFGASCSPSHSYWNSRAFQISTGAISPSATINYGLRDATVYYQTISDRLLSERIDKVSTRFNYLLYTRLIYLETRESQIKTDLLGENLLRTSEGTPGDIYAWANNRFNRRQGCYARLNQMNSLIASNQSALNINKGFM